MLSPPPAPPAPSSPLQLLPRSSSSSSHGSPIALIPPPSSPLPPPCIDFLFPMASPQASKWISFFDHDLLDDELQQPDALFWCQQTTSSLSVDNDSSKGDSLSQDKGCPKKRTKDECSGVSGLKACREKMRRDRLNDRFMELSAVLEPDKPPKTDKASILRDAARILSQLRGESQQLKDTIHQLQDTVKELKTEKNELRDEKLTLKLEKERLEKRLRTVNVLPGYMPHSNPAAVHAAVAAYSSQNQSHANKAPPPPSGYPFSTTMSHWMPPATVDTSKDHILRPPVA